MDAQPGAVDEGDRDPVLANLLRTDRVRHHPIPGDSDQATAIAVLAGSHQDAARTLLRDAYQPRRRIVGHICADATHGGVRALVGELGAVALG